MIASKTFVMKTKKGSIMKIVREHYLRDDISCGSELCNDFCKNSKNLRLQKQPESHSELISRAHYIIPDTNVILHQMDVLEDSVFQNVILLQTVLKEVRHRHSSSYNRLKEIWENEDRHFYTFINEHHKDTFIEPEKGESANDRNDRAIRVATKWYRNHLSKSPIAVDVVLLTNDKANMLKAKEDGLICYTFSEYVKSLVKHPTLVDKLAQIAEETPDMAVLSDSGKQLFPIHLTLNEIRSRIQSGRIMQGKFRASRENYLEGYVFVSDENKESSKTILVQGHDSLNRAVHDDIVAIELLPESQWSCPSKLVLLDRNNDPTQGLMQRITKKVNDEKLKQPTGRIVGIIKRNWRLYCGILQPSPIKEATRHLFVPAERVIPKIRIETRQADVLKNQRIVVAIDSWPRHSRYPLGHFVRALGNIGDKETENEVLLLEHDVPHQSFSQSVLDCLPKMPWVITQEDLDSRTNLKHLAICSVDPPGCTDIDDALHCHQLDNGNFEVGVHIADVSHFIRPGTAIDKEAASRGNTVYLVDKRIDMVPDLLSSNLCSLRGNEERFAFSCIWEMDSDANVLKTSFCKSVIKSKAALTYAEAQLRIDDSRLNDEVTLSLRGLNKLAKILKARRIESGALTLASSEVRFAIESETHDPIDVETKVLRDTNSMVEEFMLLANISVAKRIYQDFPEFAVLRRHPIPAASNFELLTKAGLSRGFVIDTQSGKRLAESLDEAVLSDNPYFNTMIRMLATRCMSQAVYFCSGMIPEKDFYHYGLAVPIYTHFTSPIRRYSDIIVHRLLAVIIGADCTYPALVDKRQTQDICNNLNYRHKMAQYAGRASVNLFTCIYFKDRVVEEEGYIFAVQENALQILLPKYGLESTLYLKPVGESSTSVFTFDDQEMTQSAAGVTLRQFDPVTVQVSMDSSNVQHQHIVLKLVKPVIPGFSIAPLSDEEPKRKKRKTE